ncbi:hypothetical protein CY34DRAFT_133572 [Suillus luteus UH-Slu-Lm8-n1]|uniref:Uncharacterized protein n=1 Tax=Suillus luteus UH-Slu-Lm8-n1 TaxID=930992 RepID=A0A0D0AL93_9AGAM|nr:hypothetical protein CY34DRAFT_133572 [Suillus luteus UH-Slu-Lm8-n1]
MDWSRPVTCFVRHSFTLPRTYLKHKESYVCLILSRASDYLTVYKVYYLVL